jgi:hypothetical protein
MRASLPGLTVFVLVCGSGCSLIAGLDTDYTTAADAGSESGLGEAATGDATSVPGDAAGDTASDTAGDARMDAPVEAKAETGVGDATGSGDSCKPEDCLNGIDDDCNGLIDCADPACSNAGFFCTAAAIPAGWTLVAYSANTRPSCPAQYGSEQAIVSNPAGAPDVCSCNCSGTAASCQGTALYQGFPNACASGAVTVSLAVKAGACTTTSTSVTAGHYYTLPGSSAVAQQGSCSGAGAVSSAPAPTFDAGATCTSPSQLGAGCPSGVCAPPTGTAFGACISHPGSAACPTFGFVNQTLVSTGSPGYVDNRTCGSCPCATGVTCGAVSNVALYTSGTCSGSTFNVGGSCGLVNATANIGSYRVSFAQSGNPTCQPTGASTPTGSVVLDSNVETICCAQ